MIRAASRIWRAEAVSQTSDVVRPWWTQRDSGPSVSATERRKARVSWWTSAWYAVDVGDVVAGVGGDELGVFAGDDALVGPGVDDGDFDIEPAPPLGVIGPERGHFRALIAGDH